LVATGAAIRLASGVYRAEAQVLGLFLPLNKTNEALTKAHVISWSDFGAKSCFAFLAR
jgi:hypothetical protein